MKVILHPPVLLCSACGSHLLMDISIATRSVKAECAALHCANHEVEISIPFTEIEGTVTRTKEQP